MTIRLTPPEDGAVYLAGQVLKAIKQLDPSFFNADLDMARAWARILGPSGYTEAEMLEGVLDFYRHETRGRRCMPANVLEGARRAREAYAATPEGRAAIEARREARRRELDKRIAAAERPARTRAQSLPPAEGREKLEVLVKRLAMRKGA